MLKVGCAQLDRLQAASSGGERRQKVDTDENPAHDVLRGGVDRDRGAASERDHASRTSVALERVQVGKRLGGKQLDSGPTPRGSMCDDTHLSCALD